MYNRFTHTKGVKIRVMKTSNNMESVKSEQTCWFYTDDYQLVNQVNEYIFQVIDILAFPDDVIRVYKVEVDLNDYLHDQESLIDYCTQYGYKNMQSLEDTYENSSLQVIAECIAENLVGTDDSTCISQLKDEEEVEKFLSKLVEQQIPFVSI